MVAYRRGRPADSSERVRSAVTAVSHARGPQLHARSRVQKPRVSVEERLTSEGHPVASGEQQQRRQMSGCNCIEQKHGGVPQRPALQMVRCIRSAVTRRVARQGFLNRTPDHDQNSPEARERAMTCQRPSSQVQKSGSS
jgi:hypothetical protein